MAIELDYKRLYEANQWLKNSPYWYDFRDNHFISADEQSDIYVEPKGFRIENPTGKRLMYIPNGKELYSFINENKKGKKEVASTISEQGITMDGQTFAVTFTDQFPQSRLSDIPLDQLEAHECSKMSLHYDSEELKNSNILIGDIIDVLDHKKSMVQNEFVFMEIVKGKQIHLFESKLGLSLRNKTLICLNNFFSLKTKKKDTTEFLTLHTGDSRMYVHYGNAEYEVVYKFHIFDLHNLQSSK